MAGSLSNNPADYKALEELTEQVEENTGNRPAGILGDSCLAVYSVIVPVPLLPLNILLFY